MRAWYEFPVFVVMADDEVSLFDASHLCSHIKSANYTGEEIGKVFTAAGNSITESTITTRREDYDDNDYAIVWVSVDGTEIGGYSLDGRA